MDRIPFSSYDFWGYLSAGFLLLFALDHVAGTDLLMRNSWTIVQGIIAVSAAYIVGHLVAGMSSVIFERFLTGQLLGYPRNVLFGDAKAWKCVRRLSPSYFQALPTELRKAALDKGQALGVSRPGEALFWLAYQHARAMPAVIARLTDFLNLYGFCRNIALVAFIDATVLAWSYQWGSGTKEDAYWALAALIIGIGMIFRYLKFLRLYAVELFTAFAYSK